MNLSELIRRYGDDKIAVQKLDDSATALNMSKGVTRITFLTKEPLDIGGTDRLGLIIWMERNRVQSIIDEAKSIPAPETQLQVTNPATIAQFVGALADHGVKLPLLPTDDDVGTLVDADGRPVLVVDVDRERSDEDVAWIVSMVQVAVNTCGGFKAHHRAATTEGQP